MLGLRSNTATNGTSKGRARENSLLRQLRNSLSGVRSRQRWLRGWHGLVSGGLVGVLIGMVIESLRLCDLPLAPGLSLLCVIVTAVATGIGGWLMPVSWKQIARLVDQHYGLKDSSLTALDFVHRGSTDPLVQLQIQDALQRLKVVDPQSVLPWRTSRLLPALAASGAILFSMPFLPRRTADSVVAVDAQVRQVVHAQAESLRATVVESLKELSEQEDAPEIKELAREVEELVEQLQQPETDQREALAKLSEMQQAMAETLNQLDAAKTAAELKQLANALAPAEALKPLAEALEQGEYDRAAEEFEKLDATNLLPKERDALADNLRKFQEQLGERKSDKLSEAAKKMQSGLEQQDKAQIEDGASQAAGICQQQGLKQAIAKNLNLQLNRLAESKEQCQALSGGNRTEKSRQDTNRVGAGESNKPLGEEVTKLDSQRKQVQVTGSQGEGESERETSQAAESSQSAMREYRAQYNTFRKQMEEVLDSEPLPLGHRSTVRRYFESIRPDNEEISTLESPESSPQ